MSDTETLVWTLIGLGAIGCLLLGWAMKLGVLKKVFRPELLVRSARVRPGKTLITPMPAAVVTAAVVIVTGLAALGWFTYRSYELRAEADQELRHLTEQIEEQIQDLRREVRDLQWEQGEQWGSLGALREEACDAGWGWHPSGKAGGRPLSLWALKCPG